MQTNSSTSSGSKFIFKFPLFWILGICVGCLLAVHSQVIDVKCSSSYSFAGMLFSVAVQFSVYTLMFFTATGLTFYVLVFFKAFIFGFCSAIIFSIWGPAGHLIHFLLFFSNSFLALLNFIFFYFKNMYCFRKLRKSTFIYFFAAGLVSMAQAALFSPFYFKLVNLR